MDWDVGASRMSTRWSVGDSHLPRSAAVGIGTRCAAGAALVAALGATAIVVASLAREPVSARWRWRRW